MIYLFDMSMSETFVFENREELDQFITDEFCDEDGNVDPSELEDVWIVEGKEVELAL